MKKAMARRLNDVEAALQRRRPIHDSYNASALLKQKLDQMAARLQGAGIAPAEIPSLAEVKAYLAQRLPYLAELR
jgi:hypothetical protein